MSRYVGATEESISDRMERHRKHPGYRTDMTPEHPDTVIREINQFKLGVYAPTGVDRWGGCIGVLDISERWNELTETRSPLLPRQSDERVYHATPELIVGDLPHRLQTHPGTPNGARLPTWTDYFTGGAWTNLSPGRFPRSNWEDFDNEYYLQPDFAPASAGERDPGDVHESQSGLGAYTDPEPCGHDEISECHCCLCPDCGSVATRHRIDKTPDYACGNPSCSTIEFEEIDVRPARRGD